MFLFTMLLWYIFSGIICKYDNNEINLLHASVWFKNFSSSELTNNLIHGAKQMEIHWQGK